MKPTVSISAVSDSTSARVLASLREGLLLLLWLHFVVGLFSPWEAYIHPTPEQFSLNAAAGQQRFGTSHIISLMEYAIIGSLCLISLKDMLRSLWLAFPIVVLSAWILLSVTWATHPVIALNNASHYVFLLLFSCYLVRRRDTDGLARFLCTGFFIVALVSLGVMIVAPKYGLSSLGGGNEHAWRGALAHKNSLGAAMSFGLIVTAYSYARGIRRLLAAATFLACALLLVMSRSATAWLATAAACFVTAIAAAVQSRQRAPVLRAVALGTLAALAVALLLWPLGAFDTRLDSLTRLVARSNTLSGRTEVWHAVWETLRMRPLTGYGYGFWAQPSTARSNIWLSLNWATPHAHNSWLDAGLQLGVIGMALTALIWLIALWRAMSLVFVRYGSGALLFLALLTSCLLQSTTETVMLAPSLSALFWWVIAYIGLARMTRDYAAARASAHRPAMTAAQAGGLIDASRS